MLSPEPDSDYDGATEGGEGLNLMKINVLSSLPEGEPQGSFIVHAPPTALGRDLLRLVCKQARVPLHPSYVLLSSDGVKIPMDKQLMSVSGIQEGKSLLWNRSDSPDFAGGTCWNSYWFLALLSFLIGAAGFVAVTIIYLREPSNTQYGIVFDAGSSHTSMYIYKWEGEKLNLTAVAVQDGEECRADGGGISSYAKNASAAGKTLVKCLDLAKGHIPNQRHSDTPVYLGATAGMRLLQKENSTASNAVLESVRNVISTYPFSFANATKQARILLGSEEGGFSWITSNYITGSFRVHPPTDSVIPDLIVKSVGALDLGGASTQITFIPNDTKSVPDTYRFDMDLYRSNYSLYTHSFLCYGVNEASSRLLSLIVEAGGANGTNITTFSNPCAPTGSVINITHHDLFASPCTNSTQALMAFGRYIDALEGISEDTVYSFHGGSNTSLCRQLVTEHMFNLTENCTYGQGKCSFNGVFQPPVYGDFYAFSGYYYLMEFLNLSTPAIDIVAYSNFSRTSNDLCAKDWDQVKTMKTSVPHNLPWYCFQSVYIDTLLVDGYRFNPNTTWNGIHFVESVSGVDAGWTLGFIIDESNQFPSTSVSRDMSTVTFSLLCVLFAAFIFTSLLFVRWAAKHRQASRRSYSFQGNTYGAI